ncbi:polyketide cyclase/dehydrase/lipid transport protein [Marinomonas alcarazii]|uniref:Polyketide cyclase/dehydrase/lipid transport protein n=1 Tax=Marinomonas alcarazii TaxID=491949 RepID=A0A318V5N0_9GAMM|nr:SRPBCC family protein [Marinomonas alcarazii]PYF82977.1 polyketide cyclase/dehydrase/lipid transport protein [Marinomonas alcarazii]
MSNLSHPSALYALRKVTRISALVILLLVVVGFFMPTDYRVERSVVVKASRDAIYQHILQGDSLPNWMFIQDGKVDDFEGVLGEGDSVALVYNGETEQGLLSVIESSSSVIRFDVRPKPGVNLVRNQIELQDNGSETLVTWTIEGDLNAGWLSPYLAFFANDIAGRNFEHSLQNLKEQVELMR